MKFLCAPFMYILLSIRDTRLCMTEAKGIKVPGSSKEFPKHDAILKLTTPIKGDKVGKDMNILIMEAKWHGQRSPKEEDGKGLVTEPE